MNTIRLAFWSAVDILRGSHLQQVRSEIQQCIISKHGDDVRFDIEKLVEQPLLNELIDETRHLRLSAFGPPQRRDSHHSPGFDCPTSDIKLHLESWTLKTSKCGVCSIHNTLDEGFRTFRQDIHLHDSDSPSHSVPIVHQDAQKRSCNFDSYHVSRGFVEKTHEKCSGVTPGLCVAQRQIIILCAMMLISFDIDILASEDDLKMDKGSDTGLVGTVCLSPTGQIPFRARRRN